MVAPNAPISVSIQVRPGQIAEAQALLDPKGYRIAMQAALSRTIKTGKTRVSSRIREELNLRKKDVDETISLRLPNFERLEGSVRLTRKAIPLSKYGRVTTTQRGARVKVRKTGAPEILPQTFRATMKSGHLGVFERARVIGLSQLSDEERIHFKAGLLHFRKARLVRDTGGGRVARLPIQERYGPTPVGVLAGKPGMLEAQTIDLSDVLQKNIASQVDRVLARRGLRRLESVIDTIDQE